MWLINLFKSLWTGLVNFLGILLPLGQGWRLSPGVRWFLHLLLLLLVLAGLYFLNHRLEIFRDIKTPFAQDIWLPLVFLLFYSILWIGWWIWKLLAFDQETSYFPDIDEAWNEGLEVLGQNGIRLAEVPVFLVLGRPESGEKNLFDAARPQWVVKLTPADPRAPVHVIADRDAVYVTCQGASLLGRLAGVLALEELRETGDAEGNFEDEATKTLRPGKREQKVIDIMREMGGREGTSVERRALRRASGLPLGPDFLADPQEVERLSARLAYLCRLIARQRQPFCPINGILLLIPLGGTDTEVEAQQTAEASRMDLNTVRQEWKLDCPIFSLLADMETVPGFKEYIRRQNPRDLTRRLGQRFPLVTNLQGENLQEQIENALYYLGNTFLQDSVYKFFKLETADQPDSLPLFAGNSQLALLLDEMRQRAGRLARILSQAVKKEPGAPLLFGGCYLGATGPKGEQAFVNGLFNRLLDEQNCVAWTPQALDEDARAHIHTRAGYVFLVLLVLGVAAFLAWPFIGRILR